MFLKRAITVLCAIIYLMKEREYGHPQLNGG